MKWSRASGLGSAPPVDSWPEFDYSGLCSEDQEFIQNREAAVRMVLAGKTYAAIEKATGVDKNAVRKLASVCLALSNDGRIMGFRGLLPFTRLDSNVRRNPIGPKRRQQQGGMSCALQDTLARFPDLPKQLIAHVRKEKKEV